MGSWTNLSTHLHTDVICCQGECWSSSVLPVHRNVRNTVQASWAAHDKSEERSVCTQATSAFISVPHGRCAEQSENPPEVAFPENLIEKWKFSRSVSRSTRQEVWVSSSHRTQAGQSFSSSQDTCPKGLWPEFESQTYIGTLKHGLLWFLVLSIELGPRGWWA